MPDRVWVVFYKLAAIWEPLKKTYGILTNYGSGWEKDVIKH